MDPTWDNQPGATPNQSPTPAPKAAEDSALTEARSALDQQLTHEVLNGATPVLPSTPPPTDGELKPIPPLTVDSSPPRIDRVETGQKIVDSTIQPSSSMPTASEVVPPKSPVDQVTPASGETSKSLLSTPTPPAAVHLPRQEAATALPEPSSHLPGYAVVLGWLVALAVLVGGLFVATEAGWLSLGIEQFWGLSNRSDVALTESSQVLAATQNYQMEGELTLTPPEGGIEGPSSVQFRQQQAGPITQLDARWTVGATSPLLGNRLAGGGSIQTSSITSGTDLYIRNDGMAPDAPWIHTSTGELTTFSLQPLDWSGFVAALAGGSEGKRLPGKTINGVRTKGYEVTVSSGQLLSLLSPPLVRLGDLITVQAWLSTGDARPQLIQINGSPGVIGSLTGQLVLAAYDELVPITVPAPDQVEVGTLSDWLEREGIVAVESPTSRDSRRRSDLDRIMQAFGEYYVAQTPPSYPVTEGVLRLDQDTAIQEALKPYLDPIPADPQTPERYYGYQSDGTTYRLTAVAEELAPDVQEENGFKLMLRTNQ